MTTYNYSAITNGQSINFSVAGGDVLHFDTGSLGAFNLNFEPSGAHILFTIRDNSNVVVKTFTLQNVNAYQMSSSMITFQNGSTFKLGDNSSATGDDAATAALTGTALGDMLITAGGGQLVEGLGGDDSLATVGAMGGSQTGGTGTDTLDGGDGNDWLNLAGVWEAQKYTLTLNGSTDATLGILGAGDVPVTNASAVVRNIENVDGSDVIDVITGDTNANKLIGNNGNDTLSGGDGNDTLNGGQGADSLVGGNNTDTVDYSSDSDNLGDKLGVVVNLSTNGTGANANWQGVIFGNVASNTALDGSGSTDSLSGIENILGSDYNDYLLGNGSANYLFGGKGSDLIGAGGGGDTVDGGTVGADAGFDWISYGAAAGAISVNLGAHTASGVTSLSNIDGISGGAFNDTLTGGDATNQWFNGEKFEWFQGNGGNDLIDGGRGTTDAMTEATREYNFARYTSATGSVTVNLSTGTASDGLSGTDTLVGINGVWGSNQADTLTGGNAAFDLIELFEGGGGDDSIDGGSGFDIAMYRGATGAVTVNLGTNSASSASTGTDILTSIEGVIGSDYDDTVTGGAGDDVFQGRKGNDTLDGAGGNDTADYHGDENANSDALGVVVNLGGATSGTWQSVSYNVAGSSAQDGWGNTDTLTSIENIRGSIYNDVLVGDGNNNSITGGDGNDNLKGGQGADSLSGDNGTDTVDYSSDSDNLGDKLGVVVNLSTNGTGANANWQGVTFGNVASNTALDGSGSTDSLSGIENILGSDYNDYLLGNGSANYLFGGKGSDLIGAGGGGDTVDGGTVGADAGFDWISYGAAAGAISVNLGAHTASGVTSLSNIDGISGGAFNDTLTGGDATNQWFNGEKFEWFQGNGGNDLIDGGRGTAAAMTEATREYNFARYAGATGSVTVDLAAGTASDGLSGTDTLVGINGAWGSSNADTLNGGNATFDLIELFEGSGGNDSINGGSGFDIAMYRSATAAVTVNLGTSMATADGLGGTDTLHNIEGVIGSDYADSLTGGSGDNVFQGRKGNDTLDGAGGNDTADYHGDENANSDALGVVVNLGGATSGTWQSVSYNVAGSSAQDGWGNTDTLTSIENIRGSIYNDVLIGDGGNNTITGGSGSDKIDGGAGTDIAVYTGNKINYTVTDQGGGVWTVLGDSGATDTLTGIESLQFADQSQSLVGGGPASYNFNTMSNGDAVTFDPAVDSFDSPTLGIQSFDFGPIESGLTAGRGLELRQRDPVTQNVIKTVQLLFTAGNDPTNMFKVNSAHITFAGSKLLLGDDLATTGDDSTTATLTGDIGNDVLASAGGSQTLNGGDGNDRLITLERQSSAGGSGTDIFNGGNGTDTLALDSGRIGGGGEIVQYTVSLATNTGSTSTTGGGNDSSFTMSGIENVDGSDIVDHITGDAGNNDLRGANGNDSLYGGDGNDSLDGGRGADLLDGGAGRDAAFYFRDTDGNAVNANLTTGQAVQGSYTDTLVSIETLIGSPGADTLTGNTANINTFTNSFISDVLMGMAGNDTLNGGSTAASTVVMASYQSDQAGVTVNLTTGQATDGWGSTDTLTNIDGVIGSSFNDSITGGSSSAQVIAGNFFEIFDGGAGNDTIDGSSGTDRVQYNNATGGVTVVLDTVLGGTYAGTATGNGSVGSDTLLNIEHVLGSNFADTLTGGDSNDAFDGFGGSDTIHGNGGIDTIRYDRSTSAVTVTFTAAGVGTATDGLGGTDTFDGIESARGSDNNDTFTGSAADESFEGMAGNDTINGGGGIDTVRYSGGGAGVTVVLAGGAATVTDAWGGTDSLTGIENIQGSHFNDSLTGDASDNTLQGLSGNDTLTGGLGKDTALYSGNKADYTIAKVAPGQFTVTDNNSANGNDGVDTLFGMETVQFSDGTVSLGKTLGIDSNGDGKTDLLWHKDGFSGAGSYYMELKNGTATQGADWLGYNGWTLTDAGGDFNGDGKTDLLWHKDGFSGAGSYYMELKNGTATQGADWLGYNGWTLTDAGGDFNGDGKTDLLWHKDGFSGAGSYYMELKNGTATLGSGWVGYDGWTLADAGGDFNGDGKTDLLWHKDGFSGAGSYYMELKNGTATQGADWLGYNGWTLTDAGGDFNGDGKTDLLWHKDGFSGAGSYYMELKNGTATQGADWLGYNGWTLTDAGGDFNGDGKTDLLWHKDGFSGAGSYYMELKNGTATQGADWLGYNGWTLADAGGDFNSDGKTDLLWHKDGFSGAGSYYMELKNGTATQGADWVGYDGWTYNNTNLDVGLSVKLNAPTSNWGNDFNGDGKTDLLWHKDGFSGAGSYYMELKNGTATQGADWLGYNGWTLTDAGGDFNGDGKTDLLWHKDGFSGAGSYYMELKNGTATQGADWLGYNGWTLTDAGGDFNGDGKTDLLWHKDGFSGAGSYYMELKNGTATQGADWLGYNGWTLTDAGGDFNGDGKTDLLWHKDGFSGAGSYYMELKNGTATLGSGWVGYDGWTLADAGGDFNGDGKTDLLWHKDGFSGAGSYYMELKNGTATQGADWLGYNGWTLTDAGGDFNGDGKTDLLWHKDGFSGAGSYYMELKNGTATQGADWLGYNGWTLADAGGDFNSDGKTDLLWHKDGFSGAGSYYMELKNGTATQGAGWVGYDGWTLGSPDLELRVGISVETNWGV